MRAGYCPTAIDPESLQPGTFKGPFDDLTPRHASERHVEMPCKALLRCRAALVIRQYYSELVDRIIEDASYWPHSSISLERPFVVSFFKDGRMAEDGMHTRTLPIGMPGTEGDHKLLPEDFCQDGAAWTAALELGGPGNNQGPPPTP
ncbi:hypothetical protein M405DRAFT_910426 [Rhizopogon salebrosus TDB-379]|nr:hypothetical protein M405DRAFT_910426 [Rhizopogon salebrosus TDB-379]